MFVRFGMRDLMIAIGSFGAAGIAAPTIFGATDRALAYAVGLGLGSAIYLAAAPALYRIFEMRPMRFPRCPHCDSTDGPWGIPPGSKPVRCEDLVCGNCGGVSTFLYSGGVENIDVASKPTFALKWPRPAGIWTRVR